MIADSPECPQRLARWLERLNPQQREAATADPARPLLILAGAGTGKTRTLVARLAWLVVEAQVPAERLLMLTFTRRAAREMLARAAEVVGRRTARRMVGGTFHSVGQRLLRAYAPRLGLNEAFTILDRGDSEDLLDMCREELSLRSGSPAAGRRRFPAKRTLAAIYTRCVNGERSLGDVLGMDFPWVAEHEEAVRRIFRRYEERKQEQDVLDFDDLLSAWRALLADPVLGPEAAGHFEHVLVDEYQDTNRAQRSILLALREGGCQMTCVGDDAQSIYGFRGATVANILDFEADFSAARLVRLEQNYRSSEPLLALTNAVLAGAREGHPKTLWSGIPGAGPPRLVRVLDEDAEARWIADEVLRLQEEGLPLRRQAVLFRAAHHSDLLEVELGRRRIPFRKYGGLRFVDAAHVKDLIAFLRILENPADRTAWFRVLKLLDGVGPRTAAKVCEHLAAHGHRLSALASCQVPPRARTPYAGLTELLASLSTESAHDCPGACVEALRAFYEPILARRYERPEARREDLEALAHLARAARDRRSFLSELALDPPAASGDEAGPPHRDEDWLVLSTIHSAKGLEWDAVYVLRCTDGMIPSDMATGRRETVEEERRVFYVALTRARQHLALTAPLRYHVPEHRRRRDDWHLYPKLSRFLSDEALAALERIDLAAPDAAFDADAGPRSLTNLRRNAIERWA
ncbi:MAG: ATP-dependent helicase [Planctomycetota bacterium]|nr:MAG: ATP-dependent helicase [Planctomycetota bacterium]